MSFPRNSLIAISGWKTVCAAHCGRRGLQVQAWKLGKTGRDAIWRIRRAKRARPQDRGFSGPGRSESDCSEKLKLLLADPRQALSVQIEQVCSILLRFGGGTTRLFEAHAATAGSGLAITGGHGDELHQIECNIFVAARTSSRSAWHIHECLPCSGNKWNVFFVEMHKTFSMIAKGGANSAPPLK